MTAKRWFLMLAAAALLVAAAVAGLNILADPFGVFGDRLLGWYAYDMTQNPKAAKVAYIDAHSGEYDAFILGASGSASFSPEKLNEYTGLRWYNAFNYGADMAYTEKLAEYLAGSCEVRQFFLALSLTAAQKYEMPQNGAIEWRPPQLGGAGGWFRFAFANPRFSFAKLRDYRANGYLQEPFDVFVPETGVYDKSSRDVEPIGSLDAYLAAYPEFTTKIGVVAELTRTDECMASVARLKAMCDARGIGLTVVVPPLLDRSLSAYRAEDLADFFAKLGEITPYYDYTRFIPSDPRFYYDTTHFRNCAGDMILADIYGDDGVYVPSGETEETELRVLLYHSVTESGGEDSVSAADFRRDMERLRDGGYTPVGLSDIAGYVYRGAELPERAVLIRLDDGYRDNYEVAYPILREFGYKAVIFAIGVSVGRDVYKDTDAPITPHFTAEEAREMTGSGLIEIQSHTYDMHMVAELDGADCRRGLLRLDGESEADYAAALTGDFLRSRSELEAATGQPVYALAYPYGLHDKLSEVVLGKLGVTATFSSEYGVNTLVRGLPQSLLCLKLWAFG
ncbi:MAG: polysaccharide deacetylase family protein [Oscillospiraceae bacterium]|jgi:peptidoglycan/xylan/chitin deacetylase (PgdA/CDA1 family)|nr:polysaccharide deacetylase family protein [Oscillospiraceae bacterium]